MNELWSYLYYILGESLFPNWFDAFPYAEQAFTFFIMGIYLLAFFFFLFAPFFVFRWLWSFFRRF